MLVRVKINLLTLDYFETIYSTELCKAHTQHKAFFCFVCGFGELLIVVMNAPEGWTTFLYSFWLLLVDNFLTSVVKCMAVFVKIKPLLPLLLLWALNFGHIKLKDVDL